MFKHQGFIRREKVSASAEACKFEVSAFNIVIVTELIVNKFILYMNELNGKNCEKVKAYFVISKFRQRN